MDLSGGRRAGVDTPYGVGSYRKIKTVWIVVHNSYDVGGQVEGAEDYQGGVLGQEGGCGF